MIYILNAPIITAHGLYRYSPVSAEAASAMIEDADFVSAVGHVGTAEVLSAVLGMTIPASRVNVTMEPGDTAVVFRLLQRLPEGAVLSAEELAQLPYELGILERLE